MQSTFLSRDVGHAIEILVSCVTRSLRVVRVLIYLVETRSQTIPEPYDARSCVGLVPRLPVDGHSRSYTILSTEETKRAPADR